MRSPEPEVLPVGDAPDAPDAPATAAEPAFSPWRLVLLLGVLAAVGIWNWRLLAVILSIVVMIFLHELGHFWTARRSGMKVTEFFLGFGPRIWSFRRGEVECGIKAIPAGAYVRIVGMMNVDEVPAEDEPRTYRQQPYRRRVLVASAGSLMHFTLAWIVIFVALVGVGSRTADNWVVDSVSSGSAAQLAGIQPGDTVLAVAGAEVATHAQMAAQVRRHPGETVPVEVRRSDGEVTTLDVRLGERASVNGTVGEDLSLGSYDGEIRVNSVAPDGRVAEAGLAEGDRILAVNGVELDGLRGLPAALERSNGGAVQVSAERDGQPIEATINLGSAVQATPSLGFLGVGEDRPAVPVGAVAAVGQATTTFGQIASQSVVNLGKLFSPGNLSDFVSRAVQTSPSGERQTAVPTPAADARDQFLAEDETRPAGIIGVVRIGEQLAESWGAFLAFFAGINIVIGVFNLIPLLPFDGGHVAVATYEKVRELIRGDGKRYFADATKLMPLAYGVVMILAVVFVFSGYLDIVDPVKI